MLHDHSMNNAPYAIKVIAMLGYCGSMLLSSLGVVLCVAGEAGQFPMWLLALLLSSRYWVDATAAVQTHGQPPPQRVQPRPAPGS